ncbi:serine hydrolase domain-containing protein [Mucilaginibacter lappiensis]|uniref:CubicO group peptidase (Beta-lactamase class C family) n=1 Tax=Mucilaginibacter lappiensis TaxID=354630 RepID=A0A1N7F197_9SPHI|nr:serine hydrolase domain-containing protein [Mucilaginibacter lappiensis]MBB6112125.1 CubicO group peptidase (beta-lactamase class C family) [Mucilaginibacter lappiensis]MBB6131312.1 CubicO group peptidase (beta-lactamase class C family) [Mucilaginibacter lappiensis]SIR94138.1 CubicO group peptidase, beta-lactamase class C family [Mucilaginibacter lappiensis]
MIQKIACFFLLFLILQSCTHAQTFNKAKLDSFFVALNTKDQNMGSISIAANGVLVYQNAIGYSQVNKGEKTPATIETKYRIGSISKMFTATMIFQLIDEGKLTFETPLATYFPQLPNAGKITIREMLSHHSGLHNFTSDSLYLTYMGSPKSEPEMVAIFAKQKSDFEPDTKAEYSNTNFVLLGYIIEKLTGKTYAEELKKRVTSKIGLTQTYYGTKANPAKDEAYSYNYAGQWMQMPETDMSIPGGAGAIVSTPADLVKFINALFAGKLISQTNLELMKTMKDNYGMAMFTIPFYDKKGFGHSGGIDGFSSLLTYFPEDKLTIAYISNGVRYSTNNVVIGALSIYFNRPFAIPEFKTITLNMTDLDKYVGKYTSTQMPLKVDITKNNTLLFAQATGQRAFPLEAQGDNKFSFAAAGITLQFEPAKKTFTLIQGGATYLFTKTD